MKSTLLYEILQPSLHRLFKVIPNDIFLSLTAITSKLQLLRLENVNPIATAQDHTKKITLKQVAGNKTNKEKGKMLKKKTLILKLWQNTKH